jgi:hypothetical protein
VASVVARHRRAWRVYARGALLLPARGGSTRAFSWLLTSIGRLTVVYMCAYTPPGGI